MSSETAAIIHFISSKRDPHTNRAAMDLELSGDPELIQALLVQAMLQLPGFDVIVDKARITYNSLNKTS